MIKQKYQPLNSNLCGQTCIAMICGISLDKAIKAIGSKGVTTGVQLYKALKFLGINSDKKMVRLGKRKLKIQSDYYKYMPKRCIAKFRAFNIRVSHWVLIWDGKTYNPSKQIDHGYEYISGYLEIKNLL